MNSMDENRRYDLIIEELRKRKMKEATVNVEAESMKVVIFRLGVSLFAFPGAFVNELLLAAEIFPVPGAPDFIPGVINNRGDIESVINLNRFLGIPESDMTGDSRIAMVSTEDMRSGIMLDAVVDVLDIPVDSVRPPLATLNQSVRPFVKGEFMYGNSTVVIIDIGSLFVKIAAAED